MLTENMPVPPAALAFNSDDLDAYVAGHIGENGKPRTIDDFKKEVLDTLHIFAIKNRTHVRNCVIGIRKGTLFATFGTAKSPFKMETTNELGKCDAALAEKGWSHIDSSIFPALSLEKLEKFHEWKKNS